MNQSYSWNHQKSVLNEITEIVMGIILLLLVMGLWVYLWVPPLSVP
jgi:hypothetical protein